MRRPIAKKLTFPSPAREECYEQQQSNSRKRKPVNSVRTVGSGPFSEAKSKKKQYMDDTESTSLDLVEFANAKNDKPAPGAFDGSARRLLFQLTPTPSGQNKQMTTVYQSSSGAKKPMMSPSTNDIFNEMEKLTISDDFCISSKPKRSNNSNLTMATPPRSLGISGGAKRVLNTSSVDENERDADNLGPQKKGRSACNQGISVLSKMAPAPTNNSAFARYKWK